MPIEWSPSAERDAAKLNRRLRMRILGALDRLEASRQGDVKPLRGVLEGQYRLRVGEWRVRLEIDWASRTLRVLRVLPRGGAYRD